jgi:hypothetical protein
LDLVSFFDQLEVTVKFTRDVFEPKMSLLQEGGYGAAFFIHGLFGRLRMELGSAPHALAAPASATSAKLAAIEQRTQEEVQFGAIAAWTWPFSSAAARSAFRHLTTRIPVSGSLEW